MHVSELHLREARKGELAGEEGGDTGPSTAGCRGTSWGLCGCSRWLGGRVTEVNLGRLAALGRWPGGERQGHRGWLTGGDPSFSEFTAALSSRSSDDCTSREGTGWGWVGG